MRPTRKLTYAAACAAIAIVCIAASTFLPFLKLTPLMICAMCFFIALECSIYYGALSIAASLIIGFFIGLNSSFFLTAYLVAPYSVLAYFIKKLNYNTVKKGVIRAVIVLALFNAAFAAVLLGFEKFLAEFLFGISPATIYEKLGGRTLGYIIIAIIGSAFMVGYDWMFIIAYKQLNKRLKFMKIKHDKPKDDGHKDVFD